MNVMLVTWQPMQLATMIARLHSIICQTIFIFTQLQLTANIFCGLIPMFQISVQQILVKIHHTMTKYLDQLDAANVYMNFDLPSVVLNSVPESNTQKQKGKNTTTKTEYSTTQLLCENKKTISVNEIIQFRDDVIVDRKIRNQILWYLSMTFTTVIWGMGKCNNQQGSSTKW